MKYPKTRNKIRSEPDSGNGCFAVSAAPDTPPVPFAAAVYPAKKGGCKGLAPFVESLRKSGVRVGGILQEKVAIGNGGMCRVDAVDIATGRRIPLNQPTPETWRDRVCSFDLSALAETTAILRRAISDCVDLMVVEKFGDAERDGAGLTDEILQGIAAGIPLLVAVPETNLDEWTERTGGIGAVLPRNEKALHEWWVLVQNEYANSAAAMSG